MVQGKKILIGVTGSISAYRVCDLIEALKAEGAEIQCILTQGGKRFMTPDTLRALTGKPAYSDMFQDHAFSGPLHTVLADEADLIAVIPSSCDFIAKLAAGICDDLLSATIIASKAPVLIAPAMNDNMFSHPMTQKNIQALEAIGYQFVAPEEGQLVCGRFSMGHIASQDKLKSSIETLLKK